MTELRDVVSVEERDGRYCWVLSCGHKIPVNVWVERPGCDREPCIEGVRIRCQVCYRNERRRHEHA